MVACGAVRRVGEVKADYEPNRRIRAGQLQRAEIIGIPELARNSSKMDQ